MVEKKGEKSDNNPNENSIDEWIEKSNRSNKLVEQWERKIVEGATAMN